MKNTRTREVQQGKPSVKSSVEMSVIRTRRSTQRIAYVNGRPAFSEFRYQTNLVVALKFEYILSKRKV